MNFDENIMLKSLEIRDTATHNGGAVDFGRRGYSTGVVIIENSLNQIVAVQLQGKAELGTTWINVGTPVNAAAVVGTTPGMNVIALTVPYAMLRLAATCGSSPASGSVSAWLDCVKG